MTCSLGETAVTVAVPRDPTGQTVTGSISVTAPLTYTYGQHPVAVCRVAAGESEYGEVLIDNAWYRFDPQE